jgi:hypothetical protein
VVEKGEELKLGCGREENGEKRERVATGGFSSASVAWGSEGEKEGGPAGAGAWQRESSGARPTGRAGTNRGPSVSGGVREGDG